MRSCSSWSASAEIVRVEYEELDAVTDMRTALDPATPVMALGLGSNLIVRDGGVPGVVVRLGKAFARVERADDATLARRVAAFEHDNRCRPG